MCKRGECSVGGPHSLPPGRLLPVSSLLPCAGLVPGRSTASVGRCRRPRAWLARAVDRRSSAGLDSFSTLPPFGFPPSFVGFRTPPSRGPPVSRSLPGGSGWPLSVEGHCVSRRPRAFAGGSRVGGSSLVGRLGPGRLRFSPRSTPGAPRPVPPATFRPAVPWDPVWLLRAVVL